MKRKAGLERKLLYWGLLAGLPGTSLALALLWTGDFSSKLQWTLTLFLIGFWLGFVWAAREKLVFSLRTLANLLSALREGDFSLRARGATLDTAMGEVLLEVNALGDMLRGQRLAALEATSLLRKSAHILLEGTPEWLDIEELQREIKGAVGGVIDVHHVHVWSLTSHHPVVTLHARVEADVASHVVLQDIKLFLARRYALEHSTIQLEPADCADPDHAILDARVHRRGVR